MMDEREDRFDEMLRDAARDYNVPPATPKAELWERIQASRRANRPANSRTGITPFRRPTVRVLMAIAAILVLGVAIGRLTTPGITSLTTTPNPTLGTQTPPAAAERGSMAAQLVTSNHLSQVETFLTEFGTTPASPDFADQARNLLGTTRLLLDSKRVVDPRTHTLLEDLELVLTQIATLNPKDHREDLGFIADGLAQNQLRSRLRNAIPAGSAIRL